MLSRLEPNRRTVLSDHPASSIDLGVVSRTHAPQIAAVVRSEHPELHERTPLPIPVAQKEEGRSLRLSAGRRSSPAARGGPASGDGRDHLSAARASRAGLGLEVEHPRQTPGLP